MNKWSYYYPRPQLKRNSFLSLDGKWKLNNSEIEVPFPPESKLSGFTGSLYNGELTYEKEFTLPKGFRKASDSVILHFGAVDQIAEVYLNDVKVAKHKGGYLPFEADITEQLEKNNRLVLKVSDHLDRNIPYGKQIEKSSGMWYTPISGIWQSVWLEAVPRHYIKNIKVKTTLEKLILDVDSECSGYFLTIPFDKDNEYKQYFEMKHIELSFEDMHITPHLWSTEDPFLYSFKISTANDEIESYFGVREIKMVNNHFVLNNKPFIMKGVLDQGYFHDGLYIPEDPLEYFNDVLKMKELGFNTLRKHIKLEPQVFYYACDKLGMLCMQDMVESGKWNMFYHAVLPTIGFGGFSDTAFVNKERLTFFEEHSKGIIEAVYSHPCIYAYTIYNEGWGQQCADLMYDSLKKCDPDRFFDATSGWFQRKKSDFVSYHIYFRNKVLKRSLKPILLSECGGYKRRIEGHGDPLKEYGYASTNSEEEISLKYKEMYEKMIYPSLANGMAGYIITQLSDVEEEINGFYTFDRQVCKVDKKTILELNENAQSN